MNPLRLVEFGIALGGLFFMSGTLTSILTPMGSTTAPMVQAIGGALGLYSVMTLLLMRHAVAQIITLYWLVLIPVLFAIVSLSWSEDLFLTLRRSGSLGLTTAFGFWLALRFSPTQLVGLIVAMAVTIVSVNFAVIQLMPTRGIHQAYDLGNVAHVGSWRGLFGHKNDFGRTIALCIAFLVVGFAFRTGGPRLRWLMIPLIAVALLMIASSNSSQASMLAATVPSTVIALMWMRRLSPPSRTMLLVVLLPTLLVGIMSAQLIFEYVLGLLGRDATLTGRTTIWSGVILSLGGHGVLGGGYGAGWQIVGPRLLALTGIDVGHAHNGFLDLVVDIGVVGLIMTLAPLLYLGALAFSSLMRGVRPQVAVIALSVVIFSLVGNVAGSFLLLHNSLYWVLVVATFAQLRDETILRNHLPTKTDNSVRTNPQALA